MKSNYSKRLIVSIVSLFVLTVAQTAYTRELLHLPIGHLVPEKDKEDFFINRKTEKHSRMFMHAYRYKNPGGKVVVIASGFLNAKRMGDSWAQYLYQQGYDVIVFDHLNFGLDGERSYTSPYKIGDYGFDGMVNGMEPVIDYAYELNNHQPVFYLSFSLGGMTYYEYISGMIGTDPEGRPIRDENVARERRAKLGGGITVAAPPYTLKGISLPSKVAAEIGVRILDRMPNFHGVVPLPIGGSKEYTNHRPVLLGSMMDLVPSFFGGWLVDMILAEVGNRENFGYWRKNLGWMMRTMFSPPHSDLLRHLGKVASKLGHSPHSELGHLPNLILLGTDDRLANTGVLVGELKERMLRDYDESAVIYKGFNHLDLMLDPMIREWGAGKLVDAYIQNPQQVVYDLGRVNLIKNKHETETMVLRHVYDSLERKKDDILEKKSRIIIPGSCESVLHW